MDSNNNTLPTEDAALDSYLTPENVEDELKKLKLLDENYASDDDDYRVSKALYIFTRQAFAKVIMSLCL